jgi:16S rRNA (adenine1518-N6/adenine1519-N6)-dimethyltransferase
MPTTRQTLSYLRNLFDERGIRPKNKLGQNFLIDLNLIDLVVRAAELSRQDLAIEVGSGTGSLTVKLAERAGAVLSFEIDTAFAALTQEAVHAHFALFASARPPQEQQGARQEHVRLLHADALRNKNELNPDLLSTVGELLQASGACRVKLVANLPYAVAVPVISNLLLTTLPVERMVVTVQWEIAERLLAPLNTRDYGALAVLIQSLAEVELVRKLAPSVFFPRPQVESAIVRIRPDADKRGRVGDVQRFRHFLRDLYAHRRKNLRGALASIPGCSLDKPAIDAQLAELGIDGTIRAETLDREQHLRLCNAFG